MEDVLGHGEPGNQIVVLEDHPDLGPQRPQSVPGQAQHFFAVKPDPPDGGLDHAVDALSKVDFPAPDRPITATNSPFFTEKLTSMSAGTPR